MHVDKRRENALSSLFFFSFSFFFFVSFFFFFTISLIALKAHPYTSALFFYARYLKLRSAQHLNHRLFYLQFFFLISMEALAFSLERV